MRRVALLPWPWRSVITRRASFQLHRLRIVRARADRPVPERVRKHDDHRWVGIEDADAFVSFVGEIDSGVLESALGMDFRVQGDRQMQRLETFPTDHHLVFAHRAVVKAQIDKFDREHVVPSSAARAERIRSSFERSLKWSASTTARDGRVRAGARRSPLIVRSSSVAATPREARPDVRP